MASVFEGLEVGAPIEVFALNQAYNADKSPVKVNLGVGGMHSTIFFCAHFFPFFGSFYLGFAIAF